MAEQLDFRISSGLKNIIGRELITDDLIAIFELVKNSYDANAKLVKIVFQNIKNENKTKGSRILIIDDGDGMSYDDLKNKWLFVGYSEKRDFEKELDVKDFREKIVKRKRIFAGAKGIGRFSCDRLGGILKLYTKKENEDNIHQLQMDWNKFEEDPKKEFQTIKVSYNKDNQKEINELNIKLTKGTILEISSLRNDNWDREKLLNLKRYMQRLINPSQVGENHEFEIFLDAEEYADEDEKHRYEGDFEIINGVVKNIVFEKLGIKTTHINCRIDEDGNKIHTEIVDKGKFIFNLDEKNEFPSLKSINIKVFYLNQEAKYTFTKIMGLQPVNYGSIFMYKNGFRVHPYGDFGDDWLGLDRRKTQGMMRFLGNREVMGRIEINGYQPDFKEVSSRDKGVIKTEGYEQLIDFFREKVLTRLEKYVREGIDWDKSEDSLKTPEKIEEDSLALIGKIVGQVKDPEKKINFNPDLLDIFKKKQVEKIPELIKNVESLKKYVTTQNEKEYIDVQLKSFRKATKILENEKKQTEEELIAAKKTSLFLSKSVSSDKEVLINLNHSIKITTFTIEKIIDEINQKIKNSRSIDNILPLIDEINLENQKIRILSSYVSFASFDTKVESIKKDLVLFIKEYLDKILAHREKGLKIRFLNENIVFDRRFKPLEISIVLDNLIDNSTKAGASSLTVKFENINKELHIFISDNGNGVIKEIEKYIFNRGYTTTDGSGIGLYHVRKILEALGWDIKFIGNNIKGLEKGACFEVVFK